MATTFERGPDHELIGDYIYRRNGSPTVAAAEEVLAKIEGGSNAFLFTSGMAAISSFFAAQPKGIRLVAPRIMYHGAQDWFRRLHERGDVELVLFDDISADGLREALGGGADVVWIETPVNPTWDVIDISAASEATRSSGGILVVDSTVAPPVTTRPLSMGADYVFHSATKYLNGHSDVSAGVLVTPVVDEQWIEIESVRVGLGSIPSPFEAWLLMRGLRTLPVRYSQASKTALELARVIEKHPHVERVLYPGLASHPQHGTAAKQMTGGFGGMLSVLVAGTAEETRSVALMTRLFTTATSLGGTESLIEHRSSVEGPHSVVPPNLLRISVGLEAASDLIADLTSALDRVFEAGTV
jgi:cystathionine gamma-synthase